MNLYFKNTLWLYLGTFLVLPMAYFIRILYAQNLSVADYGIFYGLFGFFAFFNFIRDWGINDASTYFVNKFLAEKDLNKVKTIFFFNHIFQLFLSILIGVLLFIFNDFIFEIFYKGELHIKPIFNLFVIFWIMETIITTNRRFADIFQDQRINTIFNTLFFILIIGFTITAFSLTYLNTFEVPTIAYLGGNIIIASLSCLYLLVRYKNYLISPKFHLKTNFFKKIFKYSTAIIMAGFARMVFNSTDIIIIQYFKGAEQVAFYTTAISSAIFLTMFIDPINRVLAPLVAKLWHAKEKETISNAISFIVNNFWILILPITTIFAILSDNFILAIYGKKFIEASILLKLLSIGIVIYGINEILWPLINSIGKPKELSKIVIQTGLFNFIGNLIVIKFYGTLGVVIVTICSYVIFFILVIKILSSEIRIRFDILNFFKILLSSSIFILIALFLVKNIYFQYTQINILNFLMNGMIIFIISGIFYTVSLIVTGVINKTKLNHLKNLLFS